jgi:tripartite-type tricarboxylate transporter receptor subunit TctC
VPDTDAVRFSGRLEERKDMTLIRQAIASVLALSIYVSAAFAQPYPSRIVKLVVPYPAGGAVDIIGRLLAEHLQRELNATIVVENKAGAGGVVGANSVAKAAPDGYTILLSGAATHAFAPSLFKALPYDPLADFIPITQVSEGHLALTVRADSGIKDLAGFIATMKDKGASSNYASNGSGTYPHLAMELLKQTAAIELMHIPFKGGNEAVTALLGGEVQVTLNHIPVVQPQAEAGAFRVLATSGTTRAQAFPDVPTLKESGYDIMASAWFGLFAPAKTPREIVERIHAAVARIAKDPGLLAKLRAQGDEIRVEGPDSFLALQKSELEKWKKVIAKAGIVIN